jgi:hypothetical protein
LDQVEEVCWKLRDKRWTDTLLTLKYWSDKMSVSLKLVYKISSTVYHEYYQEGKKLDLMDFGWITCRYFFL